MFDQKTDYSEAGKERFVRRFKEKDNIDKKIDVFLEYIQSIENTLTQYLSGKNTSTASGIELDRIGQKFGSQGDREGRDDAEYRAFLQVLPNKLRQAGQHEVLLSSFKSLTNANQIQHSYYYPASFKMMAVVDDIGAVSDPLDLEFQMQEITALGVNADYGLKQQTGSFAFSSVTSGQVLAGRGMQSSTSGTGGTLDYLIS
jgi:hypothetical protein